MHKHKPPDIQQQHMHTLLVSSQFQIGLLNPFLIMFPCIQPCLKPLKPVSIWWHSLRPSLDWLSAYIFQTDGVTCKMQSKHPELPNTELCILVLCSSRVMWPSTHTLWWTIWTVRISTRLSFPRSFRKACLEEHLTYCWILAADCLVMMYLVWGAS